MAILGIKTWKMENIAENDWKVGIRTRQGFGELIKYTLQQEDARNRDGMSQFFPSQVGFWALWFCLGQQSIWAI